MKNNCQNCYYRGYKVSQKPCDDCKNFKNHMIYPKAEVEFQITFFGIVALILFTVLFANIGLILFDVVK